MFSTICATLFYYLILFGIPFCGFLYGYLFNFNFSCNGWECILSEISKYAWFITTPFLLTSYIGLIIYPATIKRNFSSIEELSTKFDNKLIIRVVTRGTNPNLVLANVNKLYSVLMNNMGTIDWNIEVITDNQLGLTSKIKYNTNKIVEIIVPENFVTQNNTKYKARALFYASIQEPSNEKDWVLHLDEESKIDKRTLQGVITHIIESNEFDKKPAIGQGVISYAPDDIQNCLHWITTLTDSLRVSNDYGAFRLQYQLFNNVYIGMKGSFVLLRNDLTKKVSWDHGYKASITEDAYFAMIAKDMDYPFRFIDACVYELSPFSITDLWKQRRRWMDGLWNVCFSSKIKFGSKMPLIISMCLWSISWLSLCTIIISLIVPTNISMEMNIIYGINTSFIIISYIIGFIMTRTPIYWIKTIGLFKYILVFLFQIIGIPLFSFIEGISVLYWFFSLLFISRQSGFDIVEKEKQNDIKYLEDIGIEANTTHDVNSLEQI